MARYDAIYEGRLPIRTRRVKSEKHEPKKGLAGLFSGIWKQISEKYGGNISDNE